LQVAEADLLEADDRVDEQTARVLRLEADLGKARAKRQELIRFRDWRAGNPLLDDSSDAHVKGIRQRAGAWSEPDEEERETEVVASSFFHVDEPRVGATIVAIIGGAVYDGVITKVYDGSPQYADVRTPDGTFRLPNRPPTGDEQRALIIDEKG